MIISAKAFASRFDVPLAEARRVLRSLHGPAPTGSDGWDLSEAEVSAALAQISDRPERAFAEELTSDLLSQYAQILAELRARGVVRTGSAPLGDYAEHMALSVYGGSLAPNSAKSYDITAADGRTIQVKARTVSASTSPSAVFSVFRSFDFSVATLLVLDSRTYAVKSAHEMDPDHVRAASRWSEHVRGHLLPVSAPAKSGVDVTDLFAAYS
ncbi:DUF6998 domain-containing protein [Microbacterium hydrocarbonoxydans]|uniref:DUF6998 domain-containing protein n=1 Tax=Microbacterium hydrocarbonoxydans TaxID=273678 RepID=UPI00203D397E|nr:hypothetical protein [Microbacterium hydrocarbonoxydans]MCM3778387.1 hypothetical protein [Microbacterium hydrocarbonoxydans]